MYVCMYVYIYMTIGRREQAWGVAKAHVAATDLFANLCEAALKIGSSCTFTTALLLLYYCSTTALLTSSTISARLR